MRIDDISQLGPAAQRQILAKLGKAPEPVEQPRRRKYGNIPVDIGALHFDSKKEAARFHQLLALQDAGVISGLKLQPEFTLQEAFTTLDGERIRRECYRADFSYIRDGRLVIEDVKNPATKKNAVYRSKRRKMEDLGYRITEV